MSTDESNYLLNETETAVFMEMQNCRHGDTVAEWQVLDYRFKLVREDEQDHRSNRADQKNRQRKLRLLEYNPQGFAFDASYDWHPCIGGQWHNSIGSAYKRALYIAKDNNRFRIAIEKQQWRMRVDESRIRVITIRNARKSIW